QFIDRRAGLILAKRREGDAFVGRAAGVGRVVGEAALFGEGEGQGGVEGGHVPASSTGSHRISASIDASGAPHFVQRQANGGKSCEGCDLYRVMPRARSEWPGATSAHPAWSSCWPSRTHGTAASRRVGRSAHPTGSCRRR